MRRSETVRRRTRTSLCGRNLINNSLLYHLAVHPAWFFQCWTTNQYSYQLWRKPLRIWWILEEFSYWVDNQTYSTILKTIYSFYDMCDEEAAEQPRNRNKKLRTFTGKKKMSAVNIAIGLVLYFLEPWMQYQ